MSERETSSTEPEAISDTPNTDGQERIAMAHGWIDGVVSVDFARAQERDLTKLRAAIEEIGRHALPTTRARLQRALAGADWRQP